MPYFWASAPDEWNGTTHRDNSLIRWAADLQRDFKARMDWCVEPYAGANHPPTVRLVGQRERAAKAGHEIRLDARRSSDPDGDTLSYRWFFYPEPGSYRGPLIVEHADSPLARLVAPPVAEPSTLHLVLAVTDSGVPRLTRYARVVLTVSPAQVENNGRRTEQTRDLSGALQRENR